MDENGQSSGDAPQPIVIDLGRRKSKKLKALKQGQGKLWAEVQAVVADVQARLGETADGKIFVPIILIYESKPSRQRLDKLIAPYMRALR